MRKNDKEILELLLANHIDTQVYGLGYVKILVFLHWHWHFELPDYCSKSLSSFRKMRKQMGLERSRSQKHDLESMKIPMNELRRKYPMAGAREMTSLLFHEKGLAVSRSVQSECLHSS